MHTCALTVNNTLNLFLDGLFIRQQINNPDSGMIWGSVLLHYGEFLQDNVPCHKAQLIQKAFEEAFTWCLNSPNLKFSQVPLGRTSIQCSPYILHGFKESAVHILVWDTTVHKQRKCSVCLDAKRESKHFYAGDCNATSELSKCLTKVLN